eukprot:1537241-Amphidinium_carterae.1
MDKLVSWLTLANQSIAAVLLMVLWTRMLPGHEGLTLRTPYKVYHIWRLDRNFGRDLKLITEPRGRLPAESPAEEADVGIAG